MSIMTAIVGRTLVNGMRVPLCAVPVNAEENSAYRE